MDRMPSLYRLCDQSDQEPYSSFESPSLVVVTRHPEVLLAHTPAVILGQKTRNILWSDHDSDSASHRDGRGRDVSHEQVVSQPSKQLKEVL